MWITKKVKMDSSNEDVSDCTMEVVMKNIYTSCDPENSNLVPVSKLIEFITPYMLKDLSVLESLRNALDPGNNNVYVSSEKFYEVMNEWTKKITSSSDDDSDFNRTPSKNCCSLLETIDDKQLPYIQSTPRASFGQKLLSCEGLLNLSNVSAYSLSTSTQTKESSTAGQEKTVLEEEIKRLEHHLNKVSNEMIMVKHQLTATEEQNDILQADLDRCKTRLHSEQQIIEHLQNDKRYNDELREEMNAGKRQIEELNRKLLQYEKESHHLLTVIKQTEKENAELEEKCEELSRREQEAKKEIINIKTELDFKDQEITTVLKINDELKSKLNQQRDVIDQLTNENELLEHQKDNLEKILRENISARRDSLVYQYKTSLADSSNLPNIGTIPVYSPLSNKNSLSSNLSEKSMSPKSSTLSNPMFSSKRNETLLRRVLQSSTPKTERPLLDLSIPTTFQNYPVLSPSHFGSSLTSIKSLPNMNYIERSIVQDQSSEDECFYKTHDTDNNIGQDSLLAEISQVVQEKSNVPCRFSLLSFERNEKLMELEESNNVSEIIEICKEEINQLNIKNDLIQSKLDVVNVEYERLRVQVTEMKDKTCILEQDLNNLMIEKKQKQTDLEQIEKEKIQVENEIQAFKQKISELADENNNLLAKEKTISHNLESKNKIMEELEQNFLELKKEFTSLQIENIVKEKELAAKFNFESAYKKLQIELNEKYHEIEALTKSNGELKGLLAKLSISNQELESSLKQARADLNEKEEKSRQMMSLNENITLTAAQVQEHLERKNGMINELVDLNKRFEEKMAKLEDDLQQKIVETTEMQDSLRADMEIKNIMWRDNKDLKSQLDAQIERNEKLSDEIKSIKEKNEEEYHELLSNFNEETENNCKLCDQIYTLKNDLSSAMGKYNEEADKNRKLYEQVSVLKTDIDTIRENQNEYKEKINKKLTDYEDLINNLEKKLLEAKSQNEKLKTTFTVTETKKKPTKCFDDTNITECFKNRSFEKQKLAIDRLKEKLEHTEEQLQRERIRCGILQQTVKEKDSVEEKYKKIQLDFEQMQCSHLLEKQQFQNTINELSRKVKTHEDRYVELENRLKETEESLTFKLSQLDQQNQHLFSELRNKEFIIKNSYLEIETYKNLFNNADQKAQELSKTISVYLFQSNNSQKEIQVLNSELADRDGKILSLSSKIAEQDIELSHTLNELNEKINVNTTLEKENKLLQEMLSKSDDHKEKELLDTEQKLKNTSRLLQCGEMELCLIEKKLSDSKKEYESISHVITKHENLITNGRSELTRVTDLTIDKWESILQPENVYKELISLKASGPSEMGGEVHALENKIKIAVLLLEYLATKAPISMDNTDDGINSLLNSKNNTNQYSQSDVKMIKKFTLRPSRLSRPVSPDSPSIDIMVINEGAPQEINFNTSKEIYISPDSHMCQSFPYVSDDSYDTAPDEFSLTKENNIEFTSFQDTFPNVSDTFLEKLGLHESNPKQNLTKEETEEMFATFAIQIALDSRDVRERLQKQKDRCVEQHSKFLSLIKDVSNRLRDHKCIGASDPISPVFVLLEDMKFLLRDLTQSSEQFGLLTCENRMMKCWNLVTNYMALLKQDVTNLSTSETTQNENDQQEGTIATIGTQFRKCLQNLNNRDAVNCSSSVSSSKNAEMHRGRYRYYTAVKSSVTITFFLSFLVLSLFICIHWQCRMAAHENQVCVLDDFVKKIQIGNPPY